MGAKLQTLKGFRDYLPEEKRRRDLATQKIRNVFERHGFEPLQTPTLEYAEVILGKYGDEADRLVYTFKDRGGRKVALPYDLTVPTARVLAQYRQLPKYFRRYQIQSVFRAEKPQKGRFREFTQCDVDIFGSREKIADAEILATAYFTYKELGFEKVVLMVNDRKILMSKLPSASIIQTVDKLDKKSEEEVLEEMVIKGLTKESAQKMLADLKSTEMNESLREILELAQRLGVPSESLVYSPTLARGLDYYTGMIFEVKIPETDMGSFGGGGRYDELIGRLGGKDTPAVGFAVGFDRVMEALVKNTDDNGDKILVTVFDKETVNYSMEAAFRLRAANLKVEIYPAFDKLRYQISYASKNGFLKILIVGPDEIKSGKYTLKDLKSGNQTSLALDEISLTLENK